MAPHSCKHCGSVVFTLPTNNQAFSGDASHYQWKPCFADWTLNDIKTAVEAECPLFVALTEKFLEREISLENLLPDPTLFYRWGLFRLHESFELRLGSRHESLINEIEHYLETGVSLPSGQLPPCLEFSVLFPADYLEEDAAVGRRINERVDSLETYRLARSWIDECLSTHVHDTTLDSRPTRLIQINKLQESYGIRVVSTLDRGSLKTHFVALSYCWGGDQPHKMTKRIFRESNGYLQYEAMPQTIKDAIKVTYELGFEHLWVDSLCILQDDEVDKSREIARMPFIYRSATVTILAANSTTVFDGFLGTRNIDDLIADVKFEDNDGKRYRADLAPKDNHDIWSSLEDRGWTLQEQLLSVRMLDFRRRQIGFICATTLRDPNPRYVDGFMPNRYLRGSDASFLPILDSPESFRKNWHRLVERYTMRKLSQPTDRILAISGVATRIGDVVGKSDSYIAGHWKSMLPQDLLWLVKDQSQRQERPNVYQGPSWAWTGVNGPVELLNTSTKVKRWEWKISAVKLRLVDELAPFGAVHEAMLRLRAPIGPVNLTRGPCGGEKDYPNRFTWNIADKQSSEAGTDYLISPSLSAFDLNLDTTEDLDIIQGSCYLLLGARGDAPLGLLVKEVEMNVDTQREHNIKRYQRCGRLFGRLSGDHFEARAWLKKFERKVVDLI